MTADHPGVHALVVAVKGLAPVMVHADRPPQRGARVVDRVRIAPTGSWRYRKGRLPRVASPRGCRARGSRTTPRTDRVEVPTPRPASATRTQAVRRRQWEDRGRDRLDALCHARRGDQEDEKNTSPATGPRSNSWLRCHGLHFMNASRHGRRSAPPRRSRAIVTAPANNTCRRTVRLGRRNLSAGEASISHFPSTRP